MTSTQDSGIANDDQSESTSSDAFSCNNVIESHEIEQVDDELSPNVCESENNVDYCMQDSGLEVSEVAQTDDLNNNYHQLDQQLYRHPSSTPNSKLITEIKDKLQVSANRGRITWLTWNLLGTLY